MGTLRGAGLYPEPGQLPSNPPHGPGPETPANHLPVPGTQRLRRLVPGWTNGGPPPLPGKTGGPLSAGPGHRHTQPAHPGPGRGVLSRLQPRRHTTLLCLRPPGTPPPLPALPGGRGIPPTDPGRLGVRLPRLVPPQRKTLLLHAGLRTIRGGGAGPLPARRKAGDCHGGGGAVGGPQLGA